jgi:hypothetical protein
MAGQFPREVKVAFDNAVAMLDDQLAMSQVSEIYQNDQTNMARQGDIVWLPVPQIVSSQSGSDATLDFKEPNELVVPAVLDQQEHVALILSDKEMRDQLRQKNFGQAAAQKLSSVVNVRALRTLSLESTIFIKRTGAPTGFDDAATIASRMDQLGIDPDNRIQVLAPSVYRGYASDLQKASRSFDNSTSVAALRRADVGELSSIDHIKLDYARSLTANVTAGVQATTLAAGVNIYVPTTVSAAATGQIGNVDNRYQLMTFNGTAITAAMEGSAFTIAGVFEVHPITKEQLPDLKTFRLKTFVSATTAIISPPLISAANGEQAAVQYQNCSIPTASATAGVTFLNTVTAPMNPFFRVGALKIIPGRLQNETGSGAKVLYGETRNGIQMRMMEFTDINTGKTKYRWDVFFGVNLPAPDQCGIVMFSQT